MTWIVKESINSCQQKQSHSRITDCVGEWSDTSVAAVIECECVAQCGHVWHLVTIFTMMLDLLQLIALTLATLGGVLGEPECDR